MRQMQCPNCGSRTTDEELSSYGGRCINCRESPVTTPQTSASAQQPAHPGVPDAVAGKPPPAKANSWRFVQAYMGYKVGGLIGALLGGLLLAARSPGPSSGSSVGTDPFGLNILRNSIDSWFGTVVVIGGGFLIGSLVGALVGGTRTSQPRAAREAKAESPAQSQPAEIARLQERITQLEEQVRQQKE